MGNMVDTDDNAIEDTSRLLFDITGGTEDAAINEETFSKEDINVLRLEKEDCGSVV